MDRVAQFGVIAAREAIAHSGLSFEGELSEQTATIIGCGVGGQSTQDENYKRLYHDKARRLHPLTIPKLMVNAPASQISMTCGLRGPAFVIASACASATHAIGIAFQMVRSGQAPGGGHRRRRGLHRLRHHEGLGGAARAGARHLPAVLARPQGSGDRRGRRRHGARAARRREKARRQHPRRDRGLRHERRRRRPAQPRRLRHVPRHRRRAEGRRVGARTTFSTSTPMAPAPRPTTRPKRWR